MAYRELYDLLSKIAQKYAIKKEPDIIDTIFIILPSASDRRIPSFLNLPLSF